MHDSLVFINADSKYNELPIVNIILKEDKVDSVAAVWLMDDF